MALLNKRQQTTGKQQILRLAIWLGSSTEELGRQDLEDREWDRGSGDEGFENLQTKRISQSNKDVK